MAYENARAALDDLIRLVPDFPTAGVLFEDLTPVLADPEGFRLIVDEVAEACTEFEMLILVPSSRRRQASSYWV